MSESNQLQASLLQSLKFLKSNILKNSQECEAMLLRFYRKNHNPEKIAEILDARQSRIQALSN